MSTPVRDRDRPKPKGNRVPLPRYDQALRAICNTSKKVRIHLAVETEFAEEGVIEGLVLEVDKYDIKIKIVIPTSLANAREVWIKKAMIVSTEVL